jgi:tetratricopeptide (TPR) repeat protein
MFKGVSTTGRIALAAVFAVSAAGCGQVGALKGKLAFKEANTLYKAGSYEAASRKYAEAIAQGCSAAGECNPKELAYSYFFLASSYDNQFRPAKKGDPKNDANLTKAVQYYEEASTKVPDETFRKRALQYMVAVFGVEKLNDPAKAEPVIKRLIELDPNDPSNYYGMSKLYEDAGDLANAEAQLLKARDLRPNDPEVYGQLARLYEAHNMFDKQIEAMVVRTQKEPNSPEAQYRIAVAYWNKTCLPPRPNCAATAAAPNMRAKYVQAGLGAADKALVLRDDYIDALAYKNLLLRSQAYLEPAKADALIKQATALVDRIQEIQKRRETAKLSETAKPGK